MMTREEVQSFASKLPAQPFEVRLVDGQRFAVRSVEQFILGPRHMAVLAPRGVIVTLSLGMVSTIRPLPRRRRA
jgi:hypothetical protein